MPFGPASPFGQVQKAPPLPPSKVPLPSFPHPFDTSLAEPPPSALASFCSDTPSNASTNQLVAQDDSSNHQDGVQRTQLACCRPRRARKHSSNLPNRLRRHRQRQRHDYDQRRSCQEGLKPHQAPACQDFCSCSCCRCCRCPCYRSCCCGTLHCIDHSWSSRPIAYPRLTFFVLVPLFAICTSCPEFSGLVEGEGKGRSLQASLGVSGRQEGAEGPRIPCLWPPLLPVGHFCQRNSLPRSWLEGRFGFQRM
jgi:hypothetical protein